MVGTFVTTMSSTILPLEPKKLKKLSDEELGALLPLVKGNTSLPPPAFPPPRRRPPPPPTCAGYSSV